MIKDSTIVTDVPSGVPSVGDSQIQIPNLILGSISLSRRIDAVSYNLSSAPLQLSSHSAYSRINQAASTAITTKNATFLARGIWRVTWQIYSQTDYSRAVASAQDDQGLFVFSPDGLTIPIWVGNPVANVAQYGNGEFQVLIATDSWAISISHAATGVGETGVIQASLLCARLD